MSPILYPAKMFSFSNQMSYSKNVVDTLESLCHCNAQLYVEKWMSSSFGGDAPYNNLLLQLWHDLNDYKKHDKSTVSSAVIKAFERHIWYLTEKLFSNQLPESERQNIALWLNRTPVPSSKKIRHDFQCLTTQQSSRALTSMVPNLGYCSTAWRLTLPGSPSPIAPVAIWSRLPGGRSACL